MVVEGFGQQKQDLFVEGLGKNMRENQIEPEEDNQLDPKEDK
jgi:hypothetical protein